jgi:hypothetical protein
LVVTNLRGVGGATRIEKLLSAVSDYALRTVLIVDNEGGMQQHVDRLIAEGQLNAEDVLVQETSLEESNLSDEELVALAAELARKPGMNRLPATLTLTAAQLRTYHDDRISRSDPKDKPGLASSLEILARREEHGAVNFSKGDLATQLVEKLAAELRAAKTLEELEEIAEGRPVLDHMIQRIIKPLTEAPTDRPPRRREARDA